MNPILIAIRNIGITFFFSGFLFKPAFAQNATLDNAIATAITQLSNSQAYPSKSSYPRTVNTDGTIKRVSPGDWTCGFLPGQLWLMYEYTQQGIWKTRAEEWTAGLEAQKNNTNSHDLGFVMYSSFGNGLRLNPNDNYRNILLQAAQSLSTRYNPTVGAIQSWSNNPRYTYPVIIDNMVNLELLFWASKESGDQSFYNIAMQHALTTISNHFRTDNSSYHVVDFNPATGAVIKKENFQGLNANSTWARGQAWGLYGFTMSYRETGDTRFLDQAKKIADFITSHPAMPGDKVPFWDYDVTDYRDVSAASVTASALLELCEFVPSKTTSYYNYGINILNSLASSSYGAAPNTNNNFLLMHGVGNKPQNSEVDVPLIYSDYFFLQALMRYKKLAPFVSAQSNATGQITLQWTKSTGAYFYNIKRSTINGGPYTTIATNIKTFKYDDGGLQNGSTYYYIVVPATSTGEGIPSSQVSAIPMTPAQYSVNTSVSGNGSVSKNPDKALYDAGSIVVITAAPASGYQFNGWGGDASGVNNPLTVTVNGNKNISATFISSSNAPLVTNLTANSNRSYALDQLAVGIVHYTDRNYIVTSVPSFLNGETMIRTANDDKVSTLTSLISFTLSKPATVYIAYDPRVTSLPAWMNSFQKTTSVVGVSDSKINNMELYSKQFAAGSVTLGGNMASPAAGALTGYFVVIKEQATQSNYSLSVSTSGNGSVTKNPDQASYVSGTSVSLTAAPASGYQFSGWSGDVTGSSNPVNIVMNSNKSVTATFSPVNSTPLVTNLSVNSSLSYLLDNLAVGVLHYTDRTYNVTSVPSYLNGEVMIKTPNNDKANKLTSLISFELNRPATVYIAYDPRATSLPAWLNSYQKLTDNIGVTDGNISSLQLYSKQFSAGVVTLGGNLASPASGAMTGYFVVIKEQVQQTQYSLNVATNGNGTVTKNPDQPSYPQGSTVTLTATPASGYQFTGWSGDASGTANPLSITMNANKSVTANFAPVTITYTVTATSAGNGSVSKNPDQPNYPAGTQVTITATPASGYQFNGWTGSVTSSANPLVITVNSDVSVVANFIQVIPTFTLATNVTGSGTISKNPDQASYTSGTTVTLTATPDAGYQFTGWNGDASGTANPLSITMDANKSVTAHFTPVTITYTVTATSAGNGSVSKNPDQPNYPAGTQVTITATPASGYQFNGWTGGITSSANPLVITVNSDVSVVANFIQVIPTFTLATNVTGSGTISKNPDQASYTSGTTVTLTATPDGGYQFIGWNGDASGTANPLSITIDANKSVTANFTPVTITYTVTATSAGNGSVSKNPDQPNYPAGTQVTITATPASGYQFNGWTGGITSSANPLVITINSDVSVVANFIQTIPTFTLTTNVTGNGTISKNPDQASYTSGTTVTLTATPASGYQFDGWSGDASGIASQVDILVDGNKNVTATFSAAPVSIISDISANSGNYMLSILKTNGLVYTDRNTTAASIPSFMENAAFISPPNDHRNQKVKKLFTFNLNEPATLYIAYDSRARSLPSWMNGWNKVGNTTISLNDGQSTIMELYSRAFSPGNIKLGGNLSNPAKGAATNYFVIAIPSSQTLTALNPAQSGLDVPATQTSTTIEEITNFHIFPNPVENGIFKIMGKNYLPGENINLQIVHINGKLIQAEKVTANEIGMINKIITLKEKHASGIYFIRLNSRTKNVIKKLLIE